LFLLYLILGAVLMFAAVGWFSRQTAFSRSGWRMPAGLVSVGLLFAGLMMSFRGGWMIGAPLVVASIVVGVLARARPRRRPAATSSQPMSDPQARDVLGVSASASPQEIRAAYNRLMRKNHPDVGGTNGLAAQLNAARDRLL
jgi:DnaJ-like protein